MTIDDVVDLDITFAKLAADREKKAFSAGCWVGWGAYQDYGVINQEIIDIFWYNWRKINGK
jgi:hypothetical protein